VNFDGLVWLAFSAIPCNCAPFGVRSTHNVRQLTAIGNVEAVERLVGSICCWSSCSPLQIVDRAIPTLDGWFCSRHMYAQVGSQFTDA
jgi:hypothetical protein